MKDPKKARARGKVLLLLETYRHKGQKVLYRCLTPTVDTESQTICSRTFKFVYPIFEFAAAYHTQSNSVRAQRFVIM
jgi:hypothetical protein